ncbi:hypothetical protein [Arthrobacter sp. E3]|uniref:hypothetical protein n=1 Tax=Arthrobacter sp. E3 TaxID=517402 RepID=UPI001A951737|nr:hypothetical protein [Arthrobacter sp. E3]
MFIELDDAFSGSGAQMVVLIATLFVVAKAIRGEVHLISVQSAASKPLKQDTLSPGDFLVMRGKAAHIAELAQAHGITREAALPAVL